MSAAQRTRQPSRHARHRRHRARLILLIILPSLLALGVAAQDEQGDADTAGWSFLTRAGMGEDHVVDLWTRLDPERPIPPSRVLDLRFDVLLRADDTPSAVGPLILQAAHCDDRPPAAGLVCDPQRVEATQTRYVLSADTTNGNASYLWRSDPNRVFVAQGTWSIAIVPEAEPDVRAATFHVHVAHAVPDLPFPFVRDLVRALFGEDVGPLGQIFAFFFWVAFFLVTGSILARVLRRTVFRPGRMDPTVARLGVRLLTSLWVILGIAVAMWAVWRVNFWAGLAAIGLLSVALGFGMQNTVANIMGGVNLALDKPFVIGDRVRIGETWGEVEEVGLRSTRILTTKKEVVIVPNKLMDEREIWNYTINQPELRRDIEVLISYDSDRRLAEALMIEAAREHQSVLPYPRPRVLLRGFADSGIQLELRCWIPDARDLRNIGSDLRKTIQDKFNANGIEIPYPYRTLVEKKDLPPPKRATPAEVQEHLPADVRMPRLLYATAGPEPLMRTANLVGRVAHALDMRLIVLHIQPRISTARRAESYRIFSAFEAAARRHQVPIRAIVAEGDVIDEIKQVIQTEQVDLLVIGSSRPPFRWAPRRIADLTREIRESVKVPVMIVPRSLRITQRTLEHFRVVVEKRHIERQRREEQLPEPVGDHADEPDGEANGDPAEGPGEGETEEQAGEGGEGGEGEGAGEAEGDTPGGGGKRGTR